MTKLQDISLPKANINQTCSSHMPVLSELLRVFPIQSIIEFGSGLFSTQLFAQACTEFTSIETGVELTSIETGVDEWFRYLDQHYKNRRWTLKLALTLPEVLAEVKPCDLLFNDGRFRQEIAEKAFAVCPLIVCHDSQYEWSFNITVPRHFWRIDFTRFPVMYPNHEHGVRDDRPWTTIFTSNPAIVKHFADKEDWLYAHYVFPYVGHIDIKS